MGETGGPREDSLRGDEGDLGVRHVPRLDCADGSTGVAVNEPSMKLLLYKPVCGRGGNLERRQQP